MAEGATARPGLSVSGEGHHIDIAPDVDLSAGVQISGRGNTVVIGPGVTLGTAPQGAAPALGLDAEGATVRIGGGSALRCQLRITGARATLDIGRATHLHLFANLVGPDVVLAVGDHTTMVKASFQLHEPGRITVGDDCMLSSDVYVSLSDIHPIYDLATGVRINPAASVEIGDHVWLGLRSMVMKGARIGPGAVVAAGALVSGEVEPACIVGGTPARVLRRGVAWRRDFDEAAPEPRPTAAGGSLLARLWRRTQR